MMLLAVLYASGYNLPANQLPLRPLATSRARTPSAALESALLLPEAASALETLSTTATAAGAAVGAFIPKLIGLSVAAPVLAWPVVIFGGEGVRKSKAIQSGKKMRTVKIEAPKVRGVRLTPEALTITKSFRKEYPARDLELLWAALLKCYGSPAEALAAAQTNPQVLNPSYSFCNTMLESKRTLLNVMSEEEALEVMRLNPAVLQCGPSLDVLGAGEIKAIAQFRNIGNTLFPPVIRTPILGALCATILLLVIAQRPGADPALLEAVTGLRPFVGAGVASIFAFVLYGVSTTGRKVDQMEKRSM
jgi:hypothetical protein